MTLSAIPTGDIATKLLNYFTSLCVTGRDGPMLLSVRQPWADFITATPESGLASALRLKMRSAQPHFAEALPKDVENRGWTRRWRGTLLIHSPSDPDMAAMKDFGLDRHDFVYSAVVGLATLTDIVEYADSPWAQDEQFHWLLKDPVRLTRMVCGPGHQGLQPPKPQMLEDTRTVLMDMMVRIGRR